MYVDTSPLEEPVPETDNMPDSMQTDDGTERPAPGTPSTRAPDSPQREDGGGQPDSTEQDAVPPSQGGEEQSTEPTSLDGVSTPRHAGGPPQRHAASDVQHGGSPSSNAPAPATSPILHQPPRRDSEILHQPRRRDSGDTARSLLLDDVPAHS